MRPLIMLGTICLLAAATALAIAAAPKPGADEVCARRLKRLTFLLRMYAEDYDNRLPPITKATDLRRYLEPYVGGSSPAFPWAPEEEPDRKGAIFVCPATRLPYELNPELSNVDIGWNFAKVKNPQSVVLLRDPRPHADGRWTIGYLDGHVGREKSVPGGKK
jgi:hypothetical protein